MKNLSEKLNWLETLLVDSNAPVIEHLNPGIDVDSLNKIFHSQGIDLPDSLKRLYEWRGGTKNLYGVKDSILELLPFGKFFNSTDLFKMREINIGYEIFQNPQNFLPFFGSGESEMYMIQSNNDETVYYINPSTNSYCEPFFRSIEAMIDCIIECYEKKIFSIGLNSGLEVDFKKYYSVVEKYK